MRTALRLLLWIFALALVGFATTIWWLVYRPLPQLDGKVPVVGLQSDVTVGRDKWGVPHIRAGSVEDMAEAEGYVMAQDRLWQMDLLRRVARGQLSEILGPVTVNVDKEFRVLNFGRAAQRDYEQMDPEERKILDAYARGVNQFIEPAWVETAHGIYTPEIPAHTMASHRHAGYRRIHVSDAGRYAASLN